jgi:hypothetical protein
MKRKIIDKAQKEEITRQERIRYELLRQKVLNDISVIIQGKVFGLPGDSYEKQLTQQCIASVRNLIPNAEIIVSTWEGTVTSHLLCDKIIYNTDPGAVAYTDEQPGFLNNNNRQITSTYNGLKAATKTYAIKMRGDCLLNDTDFVYYMKEFPRGSKYCFFKQRIVIPTKYTRNPRRIAQLIHPSDIFQVGLRNDLLSLWDIPLQPEPKTTRAFPLEKRIINNALVGGFHRMKFGAEQYIWYSFCKKQGLDLELKHHSHLPANKILASEMSIINNFIFDDPLKLGVILPKKMFQVRDPDLYTHQEWATLNKKYAGNDVSKFYEWSLIADVYASNVSKILQRAQHRIRSYGISGFCESLIKYISSRNFNQQPKGHPQLLNNPSTTSA